MRTFVQRIRLGNLGKHAIAAVVLAPMALLPGCSNPAPIEVLGISAGKYDAAFAAATESARREGMDAVLLDRRGGTIETGARPAGTILELWRMDNNSFGQTVENTIAFQRRRARFEFIPAGFVAPSIPAGESVLAGAAPIGDGGMIDLLSGEQNLELRVWVYVERSNTPLTRRFAWSRGEATRYRDPVEERRIVESGSPESLSVWTPVGRDAAAERRLLWAVKKAIETPVDG